MQTSNVTHKSQTIALAISQNLISFHKGQAYLACGNFFHSGRRLPDNLRDFVDNGEYAKVQAVADKLTGDDIKLMYNALISRAKSISGEQYPVMTSMQLWQDKGFCYVHLADGTSISLLED